MYRESRSLRLSSLPAVARVSAAVGVPAVACVPTVVYTLKVLSSGN
jgi:hypothetical protein